MGRLPRHPILLSAVLGLSGCILFTDPINEAPVVTVKPVNGPSDVIRGTKAAFTAEVKDADSPSSFSLVWAPIPASTSGSCSGIKQSDWPGASSRMELPIDVPYSFEANSLKTMCICALATDHYGATGVGCSAPITPVPLAPVASIQDKSATPMLSGQSRLLCSPVHLFAPRSSIPVEDVAEFDWSMVYQADSSSSGKPMDLGQCTGVPSDQVGQHRCFVASAPGTYTITLTVKDTFLTANGGTDSVTSDAPAQFVVKAQADGPACLQRSEPDINAQRILLSRSPDLGGSYQTRTFTVDSVRDDCQPYPATSASQTPAMLWWSIYDGTSASPAWVYQASHLNSFPISQSMFPNARPGDTVKLRVEVRDTPVQKSYDQNPQYKACAGDLDICCDGGTCGGSACVRWTTWTVQFEP